MDLKKMFKDLWTWIAEDPQRSKNDWPGFVEVDSVRNECPACEYARDKCEEKDNLCSRCPIEPSAKILLGDKFDTQECLGGLYTQFTTAAQLYRFDEEFSKDEKLVEELKNEAVRLAEAIRDLEWKE